MVQLNKDEVLAIVPARGGSKRFKRKNLFQVLGKPMIQYSLDILEQIKHLTVPLVSTEDTEIREYCQRNGFDTNYKRPPDLAKDDSSIIDVILHAVNWCNNENSGYIKAVLLLQPTSPHRTTKEVVEGLQMFVQAPKKSVVSIQPMLEHPEECIRISDRGEWITLAERKDYNSNSQSYNKNNYFVDGSIYIASVNYLEENRSFLVPEKTNFLFLDRRWPVDVDYVEDIKVAEAVMLAAREEESK